MVFLNSDPLHADRVQTLSKYFMFLFLVTMCYINMYFLIPRFLFHNKFSSYMAGIAIYVVLTYFIVLSLSAVHKYYLPKSSQTVPSVKIFFFVFVILVLIAASTAIKLFQRWVTDSQRINDLEKLTIHTELEQLKNQINPHFLFNMLNNAHVLTQTDPQKASQLLLKLSDMLRYQLYDSTRNKVLLTADIQFLTDFLNLEKTRRDNFEFIVYTNGQLSGVQVTPLLYITFVENAVKHNGDSDNQSFVHLFFDVNNEGLLFKCVNSKPHTEMPKYGLGGLGLVNVKRRLQLLYPHKHLLEIKDEKDTFTVNLLIRT